MKSHRRYDLPDGKYTNRSLRTCRLLWQELCKWEFQDDGIPRRLHKPPTSPHTTALSTFCMELTTTKGATISFSKWLAIIILLCGELSSGPSAKNPLYAPFFNRTTGCSWQPPEEAQEHGSDVPPEETHIRVTGPCQWFQVHSWVIARSRTHNSHYQLLMT